MPIRNGKLVNWKVKVKGLRSLLNANNNDEEAKRVSKAIYKLITKNFSYNKAFRGFERLCEFNGYMETVGELNDLLADMYDYCDDNLIWIDFN